MSNSFIIQINLLAHQVVSKLSRKLGHATSGAFLKGVMKKLLERFVVVESELNEQWLVEKLRYKRDKLDFALIFVEVHIMFGDVHLTSPPSLGKGMLTMRK